MKYEANQSKLEYTSAGAASKGANEILIDHAIDLTKETSWHQQGYTIERLFDEKNYEAFEQNTVLLLHKCWTNAGLNIPIDFDLTQYHTVATSTEKHLAALDYTKLISTELFPVNIKLLEERIGAICKASLRALNPFDNQSVFHFRVIRPHKPDNNPLHRDVWLEDYKDCINLYIPIAGSNDQSSLIIVPESHRWPESRVERTLNGALINGVKFNVPAVTNIEGEVNYVRPDPKRNEVMVFSPYLIHGGSTNFNNDVTRISIEIRLWKV